MTNIYEIIERDHDKHRNLLERITATSGDSTERHALFTELKADVTAHANAEEQTFYAALIAEPKSQEQTRHSVSEHKSADDLIEELDETDFSSPGWLTTAKKLREELEHHMNEEEDDVFKLGRQVLSAEEAEKLGAEFKSHKTRELKEAS